MTDTIRQLDGGDPPPAPEAAARVFGGRLAQAQGFAEALCGTGVTHGLIGPREIPRIWDRHILNCAVVHPAFDEDSTVIDVGSGAGLPGLAIAIVRPDLRVTLVEPMERRTDWLTVTVNRLELDNVDVRRGRAEEFHGVLEADAVTSRAVARLDKLARWCAPLVGAGGSMVALKGRSIESELAQDRPALARLGLLTAQVEDFGSEVLDEPVRVVRLRFEPRAVRTGGSKTPSRGSRTPPRGRSGRR